MDELGDTAERILQFIQQNPGCHLCKFKVMTHISLGTVQYHLDRLEKMGRITSTRLGLINIISLLEFFKRMKRDPSSSRSRDYSRDSDVDHRTASADTNSAHSHLDTCA